jgi:hypothetical protein
MFYPSLCLELIPILVKDIKGRASDTVSKIDTGLSGEGEVDLSEIS